MKSIPDHPETIRVRTRFPHYRPGGLPLNWRDEMTGVLSGAVHTYIDFRIGERAEPPAPYQLELLIDYLRHHICAPCWNDAAREARDAGDDVPAANLISLRLDICEGRVKTCDQIDAWIKRCLEIGIDPL